MKRAVIPFLLGFYAGAFALYVLLSWSGSLPPAVALAKPSADLPASAPLTSPPPVRAAATPSPIAEPRPEPPPEASAPPVEDMPSERGAATDMALAASPSPAGPAPVVASDLERLRARTLLLPISGLRAAQLRDTFSEMRGREIHAALDIPSPRGTPVVAVDDGTVAKLFTSVRGGLTVYEFDPTGAYCYYYAHLDAYAPSLREGQAVRKGELLGTVGTSGNAPPSVPHLHFAVFKLGPARRWWEGTPINPYPVWVLGTQP